MYKRLKAESPDPDIAAIQFQYKKATDASWSNLGSPVTKAPYVSYLDPVNLGLAYGDYNLRALATDRGGKTDPSPASITVHYTDLIPPNAPKGLNALTNGGDVSLKWTANTEADLDGYNIYRTAGDYKIKINTAIVKEPGYPDQGLSDDTYAYEVTAQDKYGNESKPSASVTAKVYTPLLEQPYTPTGQPTLQINGSNAAANSTVEIFQEGTVTSGTVNADAQGIFVLPKLTLNPGENRITARARDGGGNISKTTDVVVVVYNESPAAPTGLAPSVQDYQVQLTWTSNTESDLSGYNLYRKGEKINKAVAVTPEEVWIDSSSSARYNPPQYAFDSDPESYWSSPYLYETFSPIWLEIYLASPELINHLEIHWVSYTDEQGYETLYAGKDYEIQAWSGYAWIPLKKVSGNNTKDNTFDFNPPYRTDQIRIYIQATTDPSDGNRVMISEVAIAKDNLITQPPYTDPSLQDGYYNYRVTAVDYYGFESVPSDEIQTAVGDVTPPSLPKNLIANVSASNITLSWDPSDPDTAGYNVYRYGPQGWLKINSSLIIPPTYADANLANGNYRFTVTAVDNAGNESLPSNEAMANVYVKPPDVPSNLRVVTIAEGRALNATWEFSGSGAVGFNLYRSLATGGPYQRVYSSPIGGLSYLDGDLKDGMAYYYVVAAVDSCGNESNYSSEALGVPSDRTAPPRPYLSYPTQPRTSVSLKTDKTDISGMAEPAANVQLFRDGTYIGQTTARESDVLQDFSLNLSAVERVDEPSISPDGKNLAYTVFNTSTGDQSVWLRNILTGISVQVSSGATSPAWSPDGTRLAYSKYVNYYQRIYIYDIQAGINTSLTDVNESPYTSENTPSWSGDGRKIVFTSDRGGPWDVWIKDLISGSMTQITHTGNLYYPAKISPDGQWLGYFDYQTLNVLDVVNGSTTEVDTQTDGQSLGWSPDSQRLTFVSQRNGNADIFVLEVNSGNQRQITDSSNEELYPAWSPDGNSIVYAKAENDGSQALWLAPAGGQGPKRVIKQNLQYPRSLSWAKSGEIAFIDRSGCHILYLQGSFSFSDTAINSGENIFLARAIDPSGNLSPFSEEISVVFDTAAVPDLEITVDNILIYPASPIAGEQVGITAVVKNRGPTELTDVNVEVYIWDSSGNLQLLKAGNIAHMDPRSEEAISAAFDTTGKKGANRIIVNVDPQNRIEELSKTNNMAEREFFIAEKEGIFLATTLDANQYQHDQNVNIQISLQNSGWAKDVVMEVWVEDQNGAAVTLVETVSTHLSYASKQNYNLVWNTGHTYAGSYRVHTVLKGGNGVEAESGVPFTLLPGLQIDASVVTDKAHYQANENVVVNLTVANAGQNYIIPEMKAKVRIVDSGNQDLFYDEKEVRNLLNGAATRLSSSWNTGRHMPGDYQVIMEVSNGGPPVLNRSASFKIDPSTILTGKVTVTPSLVLQGSVAEADYAIQNNGNQDVQDLLVKVLIVEPETQAVMGTQEGFINVPMAGVQTGQFTLRTEGYGFKTYALNLLYLYQGNQKSMGSASFTVKDGTPPEVSIISPAPNSSFNSTLQIATWATDSGSGVETVEYQQDGGPWKLLPVSDPSQGRYSTRWIPVVSDEGPHTANFRARDKSGNVSAPVSVAFTVDLTPPSPPVILSPPNGSALPTDLVDIEGIAEPGSSVEMAFGNIVKTRADSVTGRFAFKGIKLAPGNNVFVLTASDGAGNRSQSTEYALYLDKIPPTILISPPGNVASNVPITMTYSVTDDLDRNPIVTSNYPSLTVFDKNGVYTVTVEAEDHTGNKASKSITITLTGLNQPPRVRLTSPVGAETWSGVRSITWEATDPDGDPLTIGINYSPDGGGTWVTLFTGKSNDGVYSWDTTTVPNGVNYLVRVTASDGALSATDRSAAVFTIYNNLPPVADAGPDRNVITGTPVTLNGSKSYDPEGEMITFLWAFAEVPPVSTVTNGSLSDAASAKPTFTPDVDGIYRLQLIVNDGTCDSVPDEVVIIAATPNVGPNAHAGPDQNVHTGQAVFLDGSASNDPDHGPAPMSYSWSFVSVPAGSLLKDGNITDREKAKASFVSDVDGTYTVKLVVSDGELSSEDEVLIISAKPNVPPNANAGPDVTIHLGEVAVLNGSASNDLDNGPQPLTYGWRFVAVPTGSAITNSAIQNANTVSASFTPDVAGTYVLELRVYDGKDAGFDNVAVTVIVNSAPHVVPTGGGSYELNTPVILGGQVSDVDGDLLTFEWLEGERVLFAGQIQTIYGGSPVYLPEKSVYLSLGTHVITLRVSDGINPPVMSNVNIEIADRTPPTLAPVSDKTILWPPNHKMVDVTIRANAADNTGGPVSLEAVVASNEPQNGLGDGDLSPDWTNPIVDQARGIITLQLRAERSGAGNGRIYSIRITARDASRNSSQATVQIMVPHDQGKK